MKEYKVEMEFVLKKYACISVEAGSEAEAIDKARSVSEDKFIEKETAEHREWRVRRESGWRSFMSFLMGG